MTTTTTPSPSPSSSSSSSSSTTPTTSSSSSSSATPKITVAQLPKIVLARLIDRFLVSDSLLPVLGLVIVTHFVAAWLPLWLAIPALAGLLYGVFTIEKWRLNKLTTHRLEDLDQLFEIGNKENIHHETALWINFLLHKVLQNYGSLFNNLIKEKTNEALKNVKVPVIDGISLAKFDLGKRPPLLSDLASFDFAPNKLSFEVVIHYMSDLELEVQVLKKTFVVPITFSDFFLRIRSRINLELVPNAPPFINVASLQLLDIPTVDFSLKLFHLLDLIEIPVPFVGASYVQAIVNTVSRILLVNPTKIEVSIDELLFNSLPEMFKQQFDVSEILKKRQEKLERKDKKGNILEGGLSTVGAGVNLVGHSVLAVGEGVGEGVATVGKGVFAVGEGVGHGVFNVGKGVGKGVTAVGGGVGKLGKSLLGKKKENVEEASPTTPSSATEASQQPTVATETEGNK